MSLNKNLEFGEVNAFKYVMIRDITKYTAYWHIK